MNSGASLTLRPITPVEAGDMEEVPQRRGEALGVASSDAKRALISAILGPVGR